MIQFLLGACAGAALALLYAPATGRSTRTKLKDKAKSKLCDLQTVAEKKQRHLSNKMLGIEHKLCELGDKTSNKVDELKFKMSELKQTVGEITEEFGVTASEIADELKGSASSAKESASEIAGELKESANSAIQSASSAVGSAKEKLAKTLSSEKTSIPDEDFEPAEGTGSPHPAEQPVPQEPVLDPQWHERRMGTGA